MASVLVIPNSGIISFDSLAYSNLQIQPLSTSPRISYDGAGGIRVSSQTTAGSALERFSVEGGQGRLFTVSDVLTGILFSVNDISGLPILEVKDTDTITAGKYNTNTFIISGTRLFVGLSAYPSTTKLAISGNTTIVGTLSTSDVITSLGGNSNQWNASYTNLIYNSTAYLSAYDMSLVNANSANWNNTYTNLIYNSAAYLSGFNSTAITQNSANWNNAYTNLIYNSAAYLSGFNSTAITQNSSNWDSVYSTVNSNSAFYVLDGGNTKSEILSSYIIDVGTFLNRFSVGTADPNGNWWNYISGVTDNIQLSSTKNLRTTIGLVMSAWGGGGTAIYNTEPPYTPSPTLNSGTFAFSGVTSDAAFFTASDNPRIVLSGLDMTASYDLIIYGSRNTAGTLPTDVRYTTYYIGTTASQYSVELQTSGPPLPQPVGGNYWNSSNVVTLSNITPDSNNNIVLSLIAFVSAGKRGARTFGYINALQINARYIPSLLIGTNNRGNVVFETNNIKRITIDETGKIGINANPFEEQITIQGSVSSNGNLILGGVVNALNGNSNQWNASYTNLIYNSTNYLSAYNMSLINSNSGYWNDAYTNLIYNSANYLSAYNISLINSNSSYWSEAYTNLVYNSTAYLSAYDISLVNANSANWNNTYTNLIYNSTAYLSAYDMSLVNANSANWNNTYTNLIYNSTAYLSAYDMSLVNANSANWNNTYTQYSSNSASYATIGFVNGKFLPLSGGSITGNLVIQGSLTALGTATFANTIFTTTSAVSVINTGPGPALYVYQAAGPYDVASFYDGDGVEVLHIGNANPGGNGFVGINESFPAVELSVRGAISASKTITALGGNSDQWNTAYTNLVYNSTAYLSSYDMSLVNSNSGYWNNAYTNLVYNSTAYLSGFNSTAITQNSASWNSTYTTVSSNSANWNYTYNTRSLYLPLSGGRLTGLVTSISSVSSLSTIIANDFSTQNRIQYLTAGSVRVYQFYNSLTDSLDTVFN